MSLLKLYAVEVTTPSQVEEMRCIYAECQEEMTKRVPLPTIEEQQKWWNGLKNQRAWLWYAQNTLGLFAIGFSLLQDKGDTVSPTAGIRIAYRGMGLYRQILEHYLREAWKPLSGEDHSDTAVAKLNDEYGWKVQSIADGVRKLYRQQEIYDEIVRYGES